MNKAAFERKFTKADVGLNDCWIWLGQVTRSGYGLVYDSGKIKPAHRVSWEVYRAPIPEDHHVTHLCENSDCVNPDHLSCVSRGGHRRDKKRAKPQSGFRHSILSKTKPVVERFESKISKQGECLIWRGGRQMLFRRGKKVTNARIIACEIYGYNWLRSILRKKPSCGEKFCVNPAHFLIAKREIVS